MQYLVSVLGVYWISKVYKIFRDNTIFEAVKTLAFKNPKIAYDNTCYYISSLKELHEISNKLHPDSRMRATLKTIQLTSEYMYLYMSEYMNTTIEPIDKTRMYVKYVYNKKEYKILVNTRKDPTSINILSIKDENNNDVTDKVLVYYGPAYDLNNQIITPSLIGYNQLTVEYMNLNGKDNCITIYENDSLPYFVSKDQNRFTGMNVSDVDGVSNDKPDSFSDNYQESFKDDHSRFVSETEDSSSYNDHSGELLDYLKNTGDKIENGTLPHRMRDKYCLIYKNIILFSSFFKDEAIQKYEQLSKDTPILFYTPNDE